MPIENYKKKFFRIFCFSLFLIGILCGQTTYKRFSTNDGLAQNFVSSIVQDKQGFLWFGTFDGLSRYDGYTFRNFRNDPSDTLSLSSGFITELYVTTSGIIWIGFLDGTINLFDPTTEYFRRLPISIPVTPSGNNFRITTIVEDSIGRMWIGTANAGLIRILKKSGSQNNTSRDEFHYEYFQNYSVGSQTIEIQKIRSLFVDNNGSIWLQTEEKIHFIECNGMNDIQLSSLNVTLGQGPVTCGIDQDASGRMWFVTTNEIVSYDPKTKNIRTINIQSIWKDNYLQNGGYLSLKCDDRSNSIWISTEYDILRIDLRVPSKFTRLPQPLSMNNLSVEFTMNFVDRSGVVWFGTKGFGVYQYNQKNVSFGLIPALNLKGLTHQFRFFSLPPNEELKKIPSMVRDYFGAYSYVDKFGNLWVEGVGGDNSSVMRRYDPKTRQTTIYKNGFGKHEINGPYNPVYLELNDGKMWIINYVNGLDRFDPETNTFDHFQIVNGAMKLIEKKDPQSTSLTTAIKDGDGSAWIGTLNEGVYHLDPLSLSLKRFPATSQDLSSISNNYVITLCLDPIEPMRYIWAGTYGGGLNRMDRTTEKFLRFNERTGLPSNVINSIRPDKHGFLWISSNYGLWKLDPRTLQFRFYDINDGLQGLEYNRFESYSAPDGKLFFGGTEGVNAFYPEQISENQHIPPVVFTDLKIKNRSVSHRDTNSPLSISITETKSVTLQYSDNVITLEFAALDFINTGKNQYSHRLLGFENEWSIPTTRRTTTYTNLDPGEYIFTVKGSNGDGVWNDLGASLTIAILPPWYRTWWAYILYIISSVIVLLAIRQYELKRLRLKDELLLEQSRSEQLKGIDQMKMRFFQNISHEFRTPLTLILGPIEKLISRLSDETDKRELRMMRRNANRLLRLINQLLDISKLEAGGMKFQAAKDDIVAFVRGVSMSFHSLAERKGIFLDVHSEHKQIPVYFDKDKLEKILVNLIGNAFKFTPENGEVVVGILVRGDLTLQKGTVEISVQDTGIGIPQEKIHHVFDRFYQVDTSSTRSHEGTGIGLSLVKELIEIHKGTITVSSTPGKGTVFTISFPLGKLHLLQSEIVSGIDFQPIEHVYAQSEVDQPETIIAKELTGSDVQEENIPMLLLIEDNYDVREYIKTYVVQHYRVIEAFDGEEGIRKAKESIPDLIISDVMMPKKDGYEVCNIIKKDQVTSHIPVILLTAKAASEDKISGLEIGADDYLVKPFDSAELLVRVKNLIENRRRLREKYGKEVVTLKPEEITVTSTEQVFLSTVKNIIVQNMSDENFDVEQLAAAVNMSYTQLHRKLKAIIDQSANQFIRTMRLHRAMDILKQNGATVSETAYAVGFGSPAYFTKCFTEQFNVSPSDVRKKSS